jgi:Ca2+/Na+ antiporter
MPQPNQDDEHLKLLTIFHYIVGGMAMLFACVPIIHVVVGIFFIVAPEKFGHGSNQPPAFMGWFFVILGAVFILLGWIIGGLIVTTGRFISRRKRHAFCFVIACIEPLYALRNSARRLHDPRSQLPER